MHSHHLRRLSILALTAATSLVGCSDDDGTSGAPAGSGGAATAGLGGGLPTGGVGSGGVPIGSGGGTSLPPTGGTGGQLPAGGSGGVPTSGAGGSALGGGSGGEVTAGGSGGASGAGGTDAGDLCAPCSDGAECAGGECAWMMGGNRFCTVSCADGECPSGYVCNDRFDGPICYPESGTCGEDGSGGTSSGGASSGGTSSGGTSSGGASSGGAPSGGSSSGGAAGTGGSATGGTAGDTTGTCSLTEEGATGPEPDGLIPVCCSPTAEEKAFIDEVFQLLNEHRAANGVGPLTYDLLLESAVQGHCLHMAQHDFFDHYAPESVVYEPWDRAELCGTDASGENIAMGQRTAQQVMEGWIESPGHNENMLNDRYTRVGICYHDRYWGQLFGN